jgi:hypothetical protein
MANPISSACGLSVRLYAHTRVAEVAEKHGVYKVRVESKGFGRQYIPLRITGFIDFVHRPEFYMTS